MVFSCRVCDRPQEARGISHINASLCNWFGYDRASAYHDPITNRYRHNRRVCANTDVVSNAGMTPQLALSTRRAPNCKGVVNEFGAVRNKTVIANTNEFTDERMRLNFASFAYDDATLNLDKRSNKGGIADRAIVNINGFNNGNVRSKLDITDSN
jgi:hypothetical protein